MKNIKSYKLFLEGYEEIMKDMVNDVDLNKIQGAQKEIDKLRTNLDNKKQELETKLQSLEDLEIDTITDDNVKKVEIAKKQITDTIGKLKLDIEKYQKDIDDTKSKIKIFNDQKNQKLVKK